MKFIIIKTIICNIPALKCENWLEQCNFVELNSYIIPNIFNNAQTQSNPHFYTR